MTLLVKKILLEKNANLFISASGLIDCLSENTNEICNQIRFKIQQKHGQKDTNRFDDECIAIFNKLLEYEYITKTQLEKLLVFSRTK